MHQSTVRALVRNRNAIGQFKFEYLLIETESESPTHEQAVDAFIAKYGDTYELNALLQKGDKYFE